MEKLQVPLITKLVGHLLQPINQKVEEITWLVEVKIEFKPSKLLTEREDRSSIPSMKLREIKFDQFKS